MDTMKIDLDYYDRDVIVLAEHFYTKTTCLNEVIRGKKDKLHREDYVPKYDEIFSSLTLNLYDLKVRNSSSFSGEQKSQSSKSVRGKCTLAPSSGLGFSYFGNARLIKNVYVVVYANDHSRNYISASPVLMYQTSEPYSPSQESLEFSVVLSPESFNEFYDQAANNATNLAVEIDIELKKNCGIYEPWDPTGEYAFDHILKLLTPQILSVSSVDQSNFSTFGGEISDKFRLSWVDPSTLEKHDADDIDDWSIEYKQSSGSKEQVKTIVNRDRPSWFSRNWIWFALAIAALIGFVR